MAPFPIIMGVCGLIAGFLWLVSAGSEDVGGPSTGMFYLFGMIYIWLRVIKQLFRDPKSVLPGLGILFGGVVLILIGVKML